MSTMESSDVKRAKAGTPHLQGYIIFNAEKRLRQAKALIGDRAHLEVSRGTPKQASDYCKKENDFAEFGSCPTTGGQGKRSDWERLKEWCDQRDSYPSDFELFESFPSLYGRYKASVRDICRMRIKPDAVSIGTPRPWQRDLEQLLQQQPDDRVTTETVA